MEPKEFGMWADALKTYYPRERILPNKQAMDLWYQMLRDINYQDATKALQRWVATERWSPSIADIRKTVAGLTDTTLGDWASAWNEVTRAVHRCGSYRESEALESMDAMTRECVLAIGWQNICNSTEIGVERGHFRTMYEQRRERVLKARSTPQKLQTTVEAMLINVSQRMELTS